MPPPSYPPPPSYRLPEPPAPFLERALIFTFVIHAVGMVAMALLLLPGVPGGGNADVAARAAHVAAHPWLWRLGWLPWQLTALSDVLLGLALVRTAWVPKRPAVLTLLVTSAAVVPDQVAQVLWVTTGVGLAAEAVRTGDVARYLAFESRVFELTAVWGAGLYTLGAVGWSWCFAAAGTWSRALTRLSCVLWGLFAFLSFGPLLPAALRPGPVVVSAGNAVGFVMLEAWFVLVAERVLRRSRPDAAHGRHAPFRHPRGGVLGRACDEVAASRFCRAMFERVAPVALASDIADVVYVSYLLDAGRLAPLVPPGLELQRLGPGGRHALLAFLTYRHGHFGPARLGRLRRLFPSPVQSNWRVHVLDPRTGHRGVYFLANAMNSTFHAIAARLLAEGMPVHVARHAEVTPGPDGSFRVVLDPGGGSAPDADAVLRPSPQQPDAPLPPPWDECFRDFREFVAYCVPQDRAMSSQPWKRRVTRQEIDLGIPLEHCERLEGEVRSRAALALAGENAARAPLCFRVARVAFRFTREEYDPGQG